MSEFATRQTDNGIAQFDPIAGERRELLKRTICKDLTDNEMDLFVAVCNRRRLDPFVKQIHAVKRRQWNAKLNDYEEVMVIQTGIDGYRLVADRTHERDGVDGPWWCGPDGEWHDVWLSTQPPAAAKMTVYRKGHARGYVGIAHWAEYVQTYKDKKGNIQTVQMWRDMPAGQIAKCAEALAWRKAFPEELGGIYTDDEMGQADSDRLGGEITPPAQPVGASVPTLDLIKTVTTVDRARELIHRSSSEFRALMPRAISDTQRKDPTWFWANATSVKEWKEVLEYAVDLHEQQQHETSEEGGSPRPSSDPQSPSALSKRKAEQAGGDAPEGGDDG
jgi:phage recombination protein Bet